MMSISKKSRRVAASHKVEEKPVAEQHEVAAVQQDVAVQPEQQPEVAPQQEVAVQQEPVHPWLAIPSAGPTTVEAKPVKLRYAPTTWDENHIITILKVDAKRAGTKAARRYGYLKTGQSVKEYLDIVVMHGDPRTHGNGDLRWNIARGFISIDPPVKAEEPKADEPKSE
jgi:hypothetical protein